VAQLNEITAPGYLDGLEEWPLDVLRSHRHEADEVETGLSYVRRMIQGRLDIVLAERRRRQEGGASRDVTELIDQLPSILGDHVHAPGLGRLPALMGPGDLDGSLESRLDAVMPASQLSRLSDLGDSELSSAADGLEDLERDVSTQRRVVFEVVDRLQKEIVRRYRTGEASVDTLLS
jgi:RsiG-like